jgi:hypothetical protein
VELCSLTRPTHARAVLTPQFSIHKVYPFSAEGVAQSQMDIASRTTTGKLLIHVSD